MSKTEDHGALLTVALQDLRLGRCDAASRLPAIADAVADGPTRQCIADMARTAAAEAKELASSLQDLEGDPNLWVAGILDDAERDVSSNAAGPVRDTALIGAIRKLVAADTVSLETAVALAAATEKAGLEGTLGGFRKSALERDALLASRLRVCAGGPPQTA